MKIKQTRDTLSQTYHDAVRIRQLVFVQGQGVPRSIEIDKDEAYCLHFVLYDDAGEAAATCRILPSEDLAQAVLQRMAVLPAYRGQNLGQQLLEHVLSFCQQQRFRKLSLHAQLTAEGFYSKMGFNTVGSVFEEAGIRHITMEMAL
ncbi:GNAT family N-acetyltransferase [Streptococcus chenjunshii]|uniref:GNAT family N-acetyltransferase n=1 Tax=Streptococcus chenjunshii TaxID=2173853 RepID=A0A372KNN2_9STRE|nr:GNAT family N-acetyltransferase [Streptococcus chenjunshii]AXQ77952.1 GNAT family N-acetyltransferase [Streptococcus chenjunshii]RFU51804.1 GNAT family N-acetyltransferase [Streptococcus chenjunshii]RFU53892.1 GNAT family N-acetyltransferase [Streptococcus chenjunshii]